MRRPFLLFLMLLVLVSFGWRLVSAIYIDTAGPLYSVQLFRDIGGGFSGVPLVAAQVVTLVPLFVVFRRSNLNQMKKRADRAQNRHSRTAVVSRLAFVSLLVYVGMLYVELANASVIPLFESIERYVYTAEYGGPAHHILMRYGNFVAFYFGLFYAIPMLRGRRPDARFLFLLLGVFMYLLLVGHRFSAFYTYTSFFLSSLGVVMLARSASARLARTSWIALLVAGVVVVFVAIATYRSLLYTRGLSGDAAAQNLIHRVFVQPAELWWGTYERIFLLGQEDRSQAFSAVFIDPVASPERNSTIPYLMTLEIGDRAYAILEANSNYTGGYPEILFELFGPIVAYLMAGVMGGIVAILLLNLAKAITDERFISAFLIFYVLYPFYFFPVMGMLNFLVNWKFWLKVTAMVSWLLLEQRRQFLRNRQAPAPELAG